MFDLAILGGTILDGKGGPGFTADIGIKGNKIARIGQVQKGEASREVQAVGSVVCPGFIDTHCHSDILALSEPELLPKLMQGITSELLGQDGIGMAPMRPEFVSDWRQYMSGLSGNPSISWDWESIGQYAHRLDQARTGPNMVILIPQGNIRMIVMGMGNIPADEKQLKIMEDEVKKGMEEGAVGISLGMIYMPCIFSSRNEFIRLFRVSGRMGGFLVVHIRSGGDGLLESIDEVIAISREAQIPLHISHFKASGKRNWHKMGLALEAVDKAKNEGLDITFDIYPYTAGSTMMLAVLPPWALEGGSEEALKRLKEPSLRAKIREQFMLPPPQDPQGPGWDNFANIVGWENIIVSSVESPKNQSWVGRSVADIAGEVGKDPSETAFDILLEEAGRVGMIIFSMDEENVAMGLRHPLGTICTDGLLGGKPHPRVYGTFPRVLGRYVRERRDLPIEEAVRKMTSLPAKRLGLKDRGVLAEGMAADIVVFDPETVIDLATYEKPRQYPRGIQHVIVNGVHSVEKGQYTGKRGGQVLKKV